MTSYAAAGVDIEAGERAVELMKSQVARSRRPEVVDDASGFAGLFDASALLSYRRPLLATSTDGVGTKVKLAQALGKHDTIGIDLVGMVVDDLVVCGAEPLFMTDYIACGKVVPERIADIVGGVAEGCRLAGLRPGRRRDGRAPRAPWAPDEYDLAGAGTGVVEADRAARPGPGPRRRRRAGAGLLRRPLQRLLAGPPHAASTPGCPWRPSPPSWAGRSARSCSSPTRIYSLDCLELARVGRGPRVRAHHRRRPGGQPGPLPARRRWTRCWTARPGPRRRSSRCSRGTAGWRRPRWTGPSTWAWAWRRSSPADAVDAALALLAERGLPAWVLGEIVPGTGQARFR